MSPQTYSVARTYDADSGRFCLLTGRPGVFKCERDVESGHAVTIQGDRVTRYFNHKDS